MSPDDSFEKVMARLTAGDQDAATEVFRRFAHRLISLAGKRLDTRLRQKVDPEDVAQSVFRSFFQRHAGGKFQFTGWDGLWALLALMTVRKCNRMRERFRTGRRNVAAEVAPADGASPFEALAREPTPAEVVVLGELVEGLLRGLSERDQGIVSRALQGYSPAEIAAEAQVSERTVYRVLEFVRNGLRPDWDDGERRPPPSPG